MHAETKNQKLLLSIWTTDLGLSLIMRIMSQRQGLEEEDEMAAEAEEKVAREEEEKVAFE